jgi:hypothetical protein
MLDHETFATPPDVEELFVDVFESPTNVCNNCGTEMEGRFSPAVSGPHTFRLAADDNAHLWFGLTEAEATASGEIASVPGWSGAAIAVYITELQF